MLIDVSLYAWLVALGLQEAGAKQNGKRALLKPEDWLLGVKLAALLLKTKGKLQILKQMKEKDSPGARLYNWNLIYEAFRQIGFDWPVEHKSALASGDCDQLADLLANYMKWTGAGLQKEHKQQRQDEDTQISVIDIFREYLSPIIECLQVSQAEVIADYRLIYLDKRKSQGEHADLVAQLFQKIEIQHQRVMGLAGQSPRLAEEIVRFLAPGLAYSNPQVARVCFELVSQTMHLHNKGHQLMFQHPIVAGRYLYAMSKVHPEFGPQIATMLVAHSRDLNLLFPVLSRVLAQKQSALSLVLLTYSEQRDKFSPDVKKQLFVNAVKLAGCKGCEVVAIRLLTCLTRDGVGSKTDCLAVLQAAVSLKSRSLALFVVMEMSTWADSLAQAKDTFASTVIGQLSELLDRCQSQLTVVQFILQQVHCLSAKYRQMPLDKVVGQLHRICSERRSPALLSLVLAEFQFYWGSRVGEQARVQIVNFTIRVMLQSDVLWLIATSFLLRHQERVKQLPCQLLMLCSLGLDQLLSALAARRPQHTLRAKVLVLQSYLPVLPREQQFSLARKLNSSLRREPILAGISKLLNLQKEQFQIVPRQQTEPNQNNSVIKLRPSDQPRIRQRSQPSVNSASTDNRSRALEELYRLKLTKEHKQLLKLESLKRHSQKQEFRLQRTAKELLQRKIILGKLKMPCEPASLLSEFDSVRQEQRQFQLTEPQFEEDRYCSLVEGLTLGCRDLLRMCYEVMARKSSDLGREMAKFQFDSQLEPVRLLGVLKQLRVSIPKQEFVNVVLSIKRQAGSEEQGLNFNQFLTVLKNVGYLLNGKEASLMKVSMVFFKFLQKLIDTQLFAGTVPVHEPPKVVQSSFLEKAGLSQSWLVASSVLNEITSKLGFQTIQSYFLGYGSVKQLFKSHSTGLATAMEKAQVKVNRQAQTKLKVYRDKQIKSRVELEQKERLLAAEQKSKQEKRKAELKMARQIHRQKMLSLQQQQDKIRHQQIAKQNKARQQEEAERAKIKKVVSQFKEKRKSVVELKSKQDEGRLAEQRLAARSLNKSCHQRAMQVIAKVEESSRKNRSVVLKPVADMTNLILQKASRHKNNQLRLEGLIEEKLLSPQIEQVFVRNQALVSQAFAQQAKQNAVLGPESMLQFKSMLQLFIRSKIIPDLVSSQSVKHQFLRVVKQSDSLAGVDLEQFKRLLVRLCAHKEPKASDDPATMAAKINSMAVGELVSRLKPPVAFEAPRLARLDRKPIKKEKHIRQHLQRLKNDFSDYVQTSLAGSRSNNLKALYTERNENSLPSIKSSQLEQQLAERQQQSQQPDNLKDQQQRVIPEETPLELPSETDQQGQLEQSHASENKPNQFKQIEAVQADK